MASPTGTLSSTCQRLAGSSRAAEEAVLEFLRYSPARRQDVTPLARELGEVRMAATLLHETSEATGPGRGAPNVRAAVAAVARTATSLAEQVVGTLQRPDRSREHWLAEVADTVAGMAGRAVTLKMALNVGLEALLFANEEPAPNPSDLPRYETTEMVQAILAIRTRSLEIGEGEDAQAQADMGPVGDLMDSIQAFVEGTSSSVSLSVPGPVPGGRTPSVTSARSDVASLRSASEGPPQPPPTFEAIPVAHPAPENIQLRHILKVPSGNSEILEVGLFEFRGQTAVTVSTVQAAIKVFNLRGDPLPLTPQPALWGTHMVFCSGAPLWAFASDTTRMQDYSSTPRLQHRDDFKIKRPVVHMYNHATNMKLQTISGTLARPLAFSPDGYNFAACKPGGRMLIVHAGVAGAPGAAQTVSSFHTDDVEQAVFTPDGAGIVSISRDGTMRMIAAADGESLAKLDIDTWKKPHFLAITPDGAVIVSIWGDTVYRWDYATGGLDTYVLGTRRRRDGRPIAVSADCRFLACSTHDGVDVSDLHTGRLIHSIRFQAGFVTAAAFSRDGRYLALGKAIDGGLRVHKSVVDVWELVF